MKKLLSAVSIVLALSACETIKSSSATASSPVNTIAELQTPKNILPKFYGIQDARFMDKTLHPF